MDCISSRAGPRQNSVAASGWRSQGRRFHQTGLSAALPRSPRIASASPKGGNKWISASVVMSHPSSSVCSRHIILDLNSLSLFRMETGTARSFGGLFTKSGVGRHVTRNLPSRLRSFPGFPIWHTIRRHPEYCRKGTFGATHKTSRWNRLKECLHRGADYVKWSPFRFAAHFGIHPQAEN